MVKIHQWNSGVSPVRKNRLSTAVKMITGTMGFRLFKIILKGIFATEYNNASSAMDSAMPTGLAATNSTTM